MAEAEKKIPQDIAALPFETALAELENIVATLENEQLPLTKMFEVFERGSYLATHCREQITALEKRVEILTGNDQDPPQWQEFKQ